MENMKFYEAAKAVPEEAKRTIAAGRIKGFTDINPMWRIKKLTELFGPCGIGWYYEPTKQWMVETEKETAAFVNIDLYVKVDNEWSKPIHGTGGSTFLANEKAGPRMSDEAYKMATTDALSVACKALGIGADVYWSADRTKYTASPEEPATAAQMKTIKQLCFERGINYEKLLEMKKMREPLTGPQAGQLLQYIKKQLENLNGK
nr:MAG TPA: hypothetical protein [Caudoviricetes sp.]